MSGVRLYTVEQLRQIEARAAAGLPPRTLMQRAGHAAARFVAHRYPHAQTVVVVCGPGNNGGDGYELALQLRRAGRDVRCVALAPPATADARGARGAWDAIGVTEDELPVATGCDLAVDAVFGIGLARPLAGRFLAAAEWLRHQPAPVLALDVPSGLDADTGAWVGSVEGVRADATVSFLGAKPGLFTHAGCDAAGVVEVADLEAQLAAPVGWLNGPECFAAVAAPRERDSHKGSYGKLAVVGGGAGMVGAAVLAARAALRLGAGRVYVDCIGAPQLQFDPVQPELMFRPQRELDAVDAWVLGCGLGTDARAQAALTEVLARAAAAWVLDADALNLLARVPGLQDALRAGRGPRVLTPHPLEAARLLESAADAVQADRITATRRLAQRFDAMVVLKGAGSVIALPDGRYWINPTGGPALATAGTGDVLAGMLGALLAQRYDPLQAVLAAVWLHGAAADRYGADVGLTASEVPALAAAALADLRRR
jgi:hydroxyethylthiazole kinase-like uncharacterized protein yjeF